MQVEQTISLCPQVAGRFKATVSRIVFENSETGKFGDIGGSDIASADSHHRPRRKGWIFIDILQYLQGFTMNPRP